MKSKPPARADDEKTIAVGAPKKSPDPAPQPAPPPEVKPEKHEAKPAAEPVPPPAASTPTDDGKTTFVETPGESDNDREQLLAAAKVELSRRIRPDPSPRLQWPARDQAFSSGKHSAGGGTDSKRHSAPPSDDERTRLYNPAGQEASAGETGAAAAGPQAAADDHDPVVGWLVVMEGPGKGRSVEIGIGANSIGRDRGQKIRLDFGDQHISREKHAILIFDPKSKRFYIQSGEVRNLTYIGDELVLAPTEIKGGEIIVVGKTKLQFVAFCGQNFSWT